MQEGDPISEILVDDDDIDNYRFVCHHNDTEINLLGVDAAQNDYDGLFLFANQWKGWALIAAPPKVGATSRAKRSLTTLNNAWIESETARRRSELESKSSEFANQWKSVLLKYNQKLSKIEEEKAASRSTIEIPPFRPVFLDLRGIHSEQQILLGIWRQLSICNAQNITNLHEMLLGYFSQPSKVTILVFDHVSRIAASNLVKLFGHISDLIGVVIIAEMMLNPSLLLQEKEDKDALIGNMFVDELVQFSSALSLPWDINTDRENERILVFSGTLSNRSTKSLVLSKLGYLITDITLSPKLNVKSSAIDGGHSEIDSEAVKSDSKDFTSLSPEQQVIVIETVDIVTDLSDGIPGVIFSLLQLELPILRQLYSAKQATKSVRVRLLSTNKFVNAGRVFSVIAKLYAAVLNSVISVAKDRSDLMAILYFSCPRVLDTARISWNDAEHYSLSSLLSTQDLNAQGISDGFLLSLVSKGFLIHLSTVGAFVMPQIICHILIASIGDDSIEERITLKSFIFGQHCANLAREFGHILDQQWVSRAPDLKVVPINVLQRHIYLRRLEFVLPQFMSVVRSNCYNEESGIPLASKDVVQSLSLLVSAGGVVLSDWHSIDLKLHVVQLLSEMICSWSDDEIKRIFVTLLEALGEKRAGMSVEVLLLHATETIHLALMEWWWLSGAETFSSKHLSAIKRQETAAKLRKMAICGTELLDRLLCISRGLIDGAPSKATASMYLKSQLLMQSFKHKFFVTFALQSFALDQFQISQVVKFVDEFALQLRPLSTQIVSTLDSLDLSGLELDDEISNETSIEMSTLVDRLPVTQKLLMSLKQALRTRYNSLVGQESSQFGGVGNSSSTDAHERRKGLSLMKRVESVRNNMQKDLFQLSSEDIEKCMLIGVANNFPAMYEMVCGMLIKLLLRKHPISQHQVTAAGQSTVNTFSFPSVSSDLVYRGRLLFSLSLARQFSEAFASPSSTLWLRTDEGSSYITEGMGLLNTMGVCDTDIDGLLWSAYLQRVSDHQEGLSSTPWRTVAATIYSHPTITKAESVAMKSIRSVLRQMAQYMRMARQEYEKLYDVVDFTTEDEAAGDVERKGTNWANHLALANVSSITVANAGILYADIIACLVQYGETFVPSKSSTIDEDDDDDNLDDIFEAREICEDSLQIWSHIFTRNHLKDQSARLVFGFSYYLMYELSMFALKVQSADPSLIMSERYQGSHKSFAHLSAKEALLRLEQRQRESQFWELSFHYHNSSFQILKRIALPGTYRQCIALIIISGLNDYHEYCRYQVEIKRLMEPGKGGSESNNITEMHLPQELLETIHSMTKALQQLVQYDYHHSRRLLDNEILSFYALATSIQLQQGHESHSVLRVLQINASRDSLTDNEHQQQCYIYGTQCRLQQLSVQQLLLLFCARVYDSIIGAQSVAVAPLIATNVALPFAHPQYSSNQTSASSTTNASHEISCTGYNRAMDMFKYIMSQYRDLSILIYAQELWDIKAFPRSSSKRAKLKQSQKELLQTITIWGQIVESVFPHPYDSFFKHPEQSDTAQDASDIVPGKSRRKAVGGRSPNNLGEESMSTPWTIAALDPNDTELDHTQNENRLHTAEGDSYLTEKRIGALRETYSSLALRFADVMYLFGETLYRDGLSQYKLTPQLNDEMCELIFQQHVAAIAAARQLYEQELTPRQYCPLSLIMYRHLAQHQIAQNDLDSAIKSFEEMLRIFLETKFTSLLVLAEIYTEYGDALMLKKEHFHASLMYQMAIDYYRDYDVDAVAESQARLGEAASTELHPVASEGDESPTTSLEYVWSLFIPPHLQAKEITEGFLKERIARNLIAKAKAVFAGDDFEQAQELAEQTQHILTFYMPNLTKIDDEEAIKQEKRELRKIENMPPSTTNVSRVDKEPKDSLRVIDEEAGEDGERDEGNEGKPSAADLRAAQEEQEMIKQEREMRRQIVCSPVAVEVYLLLALVHYQFDEFEEAERYFQKGEVVMEELGEEESLTMIKIYHNRGILLHSKDEKEDAKLFLEHALLLLSRRHSSSYFQISATLDALENVCDELKMPDEMESIRKQRHHLNEQLSRFDIMREERKVDLKRLVQGLQELEKEKSWQRQRWNEEEAVFQGFDDDGNVNFGEEDDLSEGLSEEEEEEENEGNRRLGTRLGSSDGDDSEGSVSSSDVDPSDDDDEDDNVVVDDRTLSESARSQLRRKQRRRLRKQREARKQARRQRRQAQAAALLRHRLRQQREHDRLRYQSPARSGASHHASSSHAPWHSSSVQVSSWQEYTMQKRLHPVAGVGVDRMTVGMLRRAFQVLRDRSVQQHQQHQQHPHPHHEQSPEQQQLAIPSVRSSSSYHRLPSSAKSLPAKLMSSSALVQLPDVIVEQPQPPTQRAGYHHPPAPATSQTPTSSPLAGRPYPWQNIVRHQQHDLVFGEHAQFQQALDDRYLEEQEEAAERERQVREREREEGEQAQRQRVAIAAMPGKEHTRSSPTGTTTAQASAVAVEQENDADDDLPELPSGNCVIS